MCALTGCFRESAKVSRDGTFAVGSSDVHDRRKLSLRMPEFSEKSFDATQRKVDQLRMQ
jgi:hypothetical protein